MSSRRKFIRDAALASGGVLVASNSYGKFFIGKKPVVIIIGAGFSGLAAAYKLKQKNIDFTILEARKIVGGRVQSYAMDEREKLVVELGAEWVGESHWRVRTLCAEMNLHLDNNQFDTHLIYSGKHYIPTEWDYSIAWREKFERLITVEYDKLTDEQRKEIDKMDWWRYLVNNGCDGKDLDYRELLDSTDFGESIRHVSALAALEEYAESIKEIDGHKGSGKNEMDYKIAGGNDMLAKKLAEKIGLENIKLEYKVEKVVQTEQGVTVYCTNGKTFTGDKIICTVPTFALAKIQWEPGLPQEKIAAINELQYARICKNPMLFSERFWEDERFDMVTDMPAHYFYNGTKNQPSQKGALISYTIGDKAFVVNQQSDIWCENMVRESLKPAFGDIKSRVEKQVKYYWGNDQYSKGAYAMYGAGQWLRVRDVLKESFMQTHFAGEHVADWQGFMEGAIETGEAAAELV